MSDQLNGAVGQARARVSLEDVVVGDIVIEPDIGRVENIYYMLAGGVPVVELLCEDCSHHMGRADEMVELERED